MSVKYRLVMVALCCLAPVATLSAAAPGSAPDAPRLLERSISAIEPFQLRARGVRMEPLQGRRPTDVTEASTFDLVATVDPHGQRERLSWRREFGSLTVAPGRRVSFDEILTADAGYVDGVDVVFGQGSAGPMGGARLGAARRQQELLNPTVYLAGVLREQRPASYRGKARIGHRIAEVITVADQPRPATLYFVDGTLVRLITQESDFYLGDVDVRVDYSDWRQVGRGRYPFRTHLSLDGQTLLRQSVDSLSTSPDLDPATFRLPVTVPVAAAELSTGRTNAQWFNRVLAFPFGSLFVRGMNPTTVTARQIAPGVLLVPGAPAPVVSLALDLGDSVLVAEPAINNSYSARVIAAVRATWPGKPIRYVVATQWHFDTTGGIREYAAAGATALVPGEVRFFREILTRPHTIDPDRLSRKRTHPAIHPVGPAGRSLAGGSVTVHRFASAREARMLLVCTRDSDLAYTGDLFNPDVFPAVGRGPEPYRTWAKDLYTAIRQHCPQVTRVLASHGLPQPLPIAALEANAR